MPKPVDDALFHEALAAVLRAEAGAADWAIPEVAKHAGLEVQTVRRTFKHGRAATVLELVKMARAFGVEPEELLHRALQRSTQLGTQATGVRNRMKDELG